MEMIRELYPESIYAVGSGTCGVWGIGQVGQEEDEKKQAEFFSLVTGFVPVSYRADDSV